MVPHYMKYLKLKKKKLILEIVKYIDKINKISLR
jgi:hypothetical protein